MILKVLIVEDEEIIRLGLVSTLDWMGMGCSVAGSAGDGFEGLKKIIDLKPDIVICDIRMPGMSGLDMLEEGAKYHSFKSILLTSYTDFEYARRALSIRAYTYLLKPLDEAELSLVIGHIHQDVLREEAIKKISTLSDSSMVLSLQHLDDWFIHDRTRDCYVEAALKKITEYSNQKISIESIAEELYVSPSYLSRRFKTVMGTTFLDALNLYRVQQAIRLMREGEKHIAEISGRVGFGNYKHFCNVFKRYTGMTPRDFLKNE